MEGSAGRDTATVKKSVLEELGLPTPTRRAGAEPVSVVKHLPGSKSAAADTAGQETDLWFGGCACQAALVDLLLCVALTVSLYMTSTHLAVESGPRTKVALQHLAHGGVGAVWLAQLFRWGYRILCYQVRVTTRRLICERGWLYSQPQIVPLGQFVRVEKRPGLLGRWLGTANIMLYGEKPGTEACLVGIRNPDGLVNLLRQHIEKTRQAEVTSAKLQVQL